MWRPTPSCCVGSEGDVLYRWTFSSALECDERHTTADAYTSLPEPSPRLDALELLRASTRRHRDLDVVQGGHDLDADDRRELALPDGRHAEAADGALAVDRQPHV